MNFSAASSDEPIVAAWSLLLKLKSSTFNLEPLQYFQSKHFTLKPLYSRVSSFSPSHGSDNSVTASMTPEVLTDIVLKRERSRSPRRRSRSPRRSRRSYSPRSRSRSREDYRRTDRRSRSPMTGVPGAYSGSSYGRGGPQPPTRSFEERAQAKEQMMASVRESSQQERRVYVGNLSYDVKWHHLKDFMRQGEIQLSRFPSPSSADTMR